MTKVFWQVVHHAVAHPLVGVTYGRLWAWRFHDWTARQAWPSEPQEPGRTMPGVA